MFKKIEYSKLNPKQQENYNYHKVSAILTEYGFNTLRLSDDWQGADFIAMHINGKDFLKVQLKGRFTFAKKYIGKNIWICFFYKTKCFLFPHDTLLETLKDTMNFTNTKYWQNKNEYHWGSLNKKQILALSQYKL